MKNKVSNYEKFEKKQQPPQFRCLNVSLGVSICLGHVSQKISLDSQENLDTFQKFVLMIEISWFHLNINIQASTSQLRSRFIKTFQIFMHFSIITGSQSRHNVFLQISWSRFYFPAFFVYILFFKIGFKMGKKCGKFKFLFQKLRNH
jgi:hypothetical protein